MSLSALILCSCMPLRQEIAATLPIDTQYLPTPDRHLNIDGLGPCTAQKDRSLHLKSGEPVTVLVHGCHASAGRFRSLAEVFAFQGQQAICYNYDDRASLTRVARELRRTLDTLAEKTDHPAITLIGHSQGGLISRRALSERVDDAPNLNTNRQQLITLSTPFSGIRSADHCASKTARILSLGLVIPICMAISGDKWFEITRASKFIRQPGRLHTNVKDHLIIATDERDSCRTWEDNRCREDDYVFSLAEQALPSAMTDSVVRNRVVKAGHAEIVGYGESIPHTLISTLQEEGILRETKRARLGDYNELLKVLFLQPRQASR